MALALRFKITYTPTEDHPDGETVELVTSPIDAMRWEQRHGNGRSFANDEPTVQQLLWTAWSSACRQGLADKRGKFEEWVERVDDFESLGGAGVPTRQETPDEISSD